MTDRILLERPPARRRFAASPPGSAPARPGAPERAPPASAPLAAILRSSAAQIYDLRHRRDVVALAGKAFRGKGDHAAVAQLTRSIASELVVQLRDALVLADREGVIRCPRPTETAEQFFRVIFAMTIWPALSGRPEWPDPAVQMLFERAAELLVQPGRPVPPFLL